MEAARNYLKAFEAIKLFIEEVGYDKKPYIDTNVAGNQLILVIRNNDQRRLVKYVFEDLEDYHFRILDTKMVMWDEETPALKVKAKVTEKSVELYEPILN